MYHEYLLGQLEKLGGFVLFNESVYTNMTYSSNVFVKGINLFVIMDPLLLCTNKNTFVTLSTFTQNS